MANTTQDQQNPDIANSVLNNILALAPKAQDITSYPMGTALSQGIGQGTAIAPMMADAAKKVLMKDLVNHAQNLIDSNQDQGRQILAAHAAPLYNTGSPSGDMALNAGSQTGQGQASGQYLGYQLPSTTGISTGDETGNNPTPNQSQTQVTPQHLNLLQSILAGAGMAGLNQVGLGPAQMAQANQMNAGAANTRQQTQNITPGQPLNPENQANLNLRQQENQLKIYGAQIGAHSDNLSRLTDAEKNENDSIANLSKLSPFEMNPVDKANQIAAHVKNLQTIAVQKQGLYSNLGILAANSPKLSKTSMGAPTVSNKNLQKYSRTGTFNGRRVGMKSDGTVEYVNA